MARIKLVIADPDRRYVKSLERYIMENHSADFCISSFSESGELNTFLTRAKSPPDLILTAQEYKKQLEFAIEPEEKKGKLILLTEEPVPRRPEQTDLMFKYQHGDKILAQIIAAYSKNCKATNSFVCKKRTMLVSFISAAGGSGKSGIAAGLSILAARKGLKVFYLNLEDVPSTSQYFCGDSDSNLSDIIYYLKERDVKLPFKIEAAKCVDADSSVHYLLPPDSISEMEDLDAGDVELLMDNFGARSSYDIVFVDISSRLDRKNITVLNKSDLVVHVFPADSPMAARNKIFESELDGSSNPDIDDLSGRVIRVLNKYEALQGTSSVSVGNFEYVIPKINFLLSLKDDFLSELSGLLERILGKGGIACHEQRERTLSVC